jgi:hypothetical protein
MSLMLDMHIDLYAKLIYVIASFILFKFVLYLNYI